MFQSNNRHFGWRNVTMMGCHLFNAYTTISLCTSFTTANTVLEVLKYLFACSHKALFPMSFSINCTWVDVTGHSLPTCGYLLITNQGETELEVNETRWSRHKWVWSSCLICFASQQRRLCTVIISHRVHLFDYLLHGPLQKHSTNDNLALIGIKLMWLFHHAPRPEHSTKCNVIKHGSKHGSLRPVNPVFLFI